MQRARSTHLGVDQRLTRETLDPIEAAGIAGVERFCARQQFDYTNAPPGRAPAAGFAGHALAPHS